MNPALVWRLAVGLGGGEARLAGSWQTLLALGLGAALLVASLAVFRGFEHELLTRILNFGTHIALTDRRHVGIEDWARQSEQVKTQIAGAREIVAFVQIEGMLSRGSQRAVASIQSFALDASQRSKMLGLELDEAQTSALGDKQLLLGDDLAKELGIDAQMLDEDEVSVHLLLRGGSEQRLQLRKFSVGGLFATGTDLDRFTALLDFDVASALAGHPGAAGGLGVLLDDPLQAPALVAEIESQGRWLAQDWSQWFGDLYEAVQLSRQLLVILLMAAILIATFNLSVGLIIGIDRCRGELAMLRTMGASVRMLKAAMLLRAALLSVGGAALGIAIGAPGVAALAEIIAIAQKHSDWRLLPEGMYFLDYVPIRFAIGDISTVVIVSLLLCLPASWLAVRHIERLRPTEVLRWE